MKTADIQLKKPFDWQKFSDKWNQLTNRLAQTLASYNSRYWEKEIPMKDFKKKDIQIDVDGHFMTITAECSESLEEIYDGFSGSHHKRRCFKRTFGLPFNADKQKVKARFKNGVLSIKIADPRKRQTIAVA